MWGEAGPDVDLVPYSAVIRGIVQNGSPDVQSSRHKKCLNLLVPFTINQQNGSPSCAFFEITGTLKNE